jgi:hypothetical protein
MRFREDDPRYAGLFECIQALQPGLKNKRLLEIVLHGLLSKAAPVLAQPGSMSVQHPTAPRTIDTKPSDPPDRPIGRGAQTILTQSWD